MELRAQFGSPAQLPSRGLLYGSSILDGRVIVAPMVGDDEEMVATSGAGMGEYVVNSLIANCVFDQNGEHIRDLSPADFLLGDRVYLMQVLRCVTHGAAYQFDLDCMACRRSFSTTVKVPDELEIVWLKDNFVEPFDFTAPFSKFRFELRLRRGRDAIAIDEFADRDKERQKRAAGGQSLTPGSTTEVQIVKRDPTYWYKIVRCILAIDIPEKHPLVQSLGQRLINDGTPETEEKIIQLLRMMHSGDTNGLRNHIDANDCGVDPVKEFKCPRCDYTFVAGVPGGAAFFRPRSRTGVANLS